MVKLALERVTLGGLPWPKGKAAALPIAVDLGSGDGRLVAALGGSGCDYCGHAVSIDL